MTRKRPNLIFSIKEERTISQTQYSIKKALSRLPFQHRPSSRRSISSFSVGFIQDLTMSSKKATTKAASDGPIATATDPKNELETIVESVHILLDGWRFLKIPEVQKRIQNIKTATAPELERVDKIAELKRTLETLSAVKDEEIRKIKEDKDKKIRALEAENNKLKKESDLVADERENIATEKAKLEQARQTVQERHRDKETKLVKKMEEKYLKKTKDAQSSIQANMRKLEKEKNDAIGSNGKLTTEISRLEMYRDAMEKRNGELKEEVRTLQERLCTLSAKTAVSRTPFDEYEKYVEHMYQLTEKFATKLSENLPEKAALVFEPLGSKDKLGQASRIFDYTSCSSTGVAISLRKAAVQNFVSGHLISIFRDTLLLGIDTNNSAGREDEAILNMISTTLSPDDEKIWRGITVKALDKLPKFSSLTQTIEKVAQETVNKLQLLIHDSEQESSAVRKEVAEIMKAALKIWFLRRNDSCTITFNGAPGPKNDGSWDAWIVEEDSVPAAFSFPSNRVNAINGINGNGSGTSNGPESATTSSTLQPPSIRQAAESFVIFPQIIGEFESDDKDNGRGGSNSKSQKGKRIVLHRGFALFSDSPAFDIGMRDIQALKDDFRGLRHRRRQSSLSSPTYPHNSSGEPARVNG
ncbi:hypothetical protein ACJ72_04731 [Emergomyces africanus]|uniref:Uncharacterized protein n=1 Tax=Emergomyces africanus TaxID=1955775 RepID=A0A1B7NVY5_9EURO|nr:hypothetical protein ACJ72_04731 [Emergomyces africanus]